ncbi:MAG: class I SAM-dependent methyltransferase [Bradymonadales bacterium]|nr:class I SAM-dependent methyltransferase [Bradymonadales bacterium]
MSGEESRTGRLCPWWIGHLLASRVRRLFENPERIVGPYLKEGLTTLDIGCGMGFFTLPMARLVGPQGKVIAVDRQLRMLASLERRASKAALADRIICHHCEAKSLRLERYRKQIDFALAFYVVHEVRDPDRLFAELREAIKEGGRLLVAEPPRGLFTGDFQATLDLARGCGFTILDRPAIGSRKDRSALLG